MRHGYFLILALIITACAASGGRSPDTRGPVTEYTAKESRDRLLEYMREIQGKYILSGQMDTAWSDSIDPVERIFADTGRYPAIKGFDFLNIRYPDYGGGGSKQTEAAIRWWRNSPVKGKNGIVTFCWHWRMPLSGTARGGRDNYRPGFIIPFRDGRLDFEDPKFTLIQEDLALVAEEFEKLRRAGVPVLWRPFHEAGNLYSQPGWFWWGTNRDSYKALWAYMYDYFTNVKKLDNLIWVWNGQNGNWYPDPDTVDIAGYDCYDNNREMFGYKPNYVNTWHTYYLLLKTWAPDKLYALTENGAIPDPDALITSGTNWLWFMTWDDHSAMPGMTSKSNHWTGEWHNTNAHKKHVYRHPYVLTLDELPPLAWH
jgi:mannan endo-1,4-beta-mannosidase